MPAGAESFCALLIQNGANVCAVQRPVSGSNRCIAERIRANFSTRFAYPAPILVFLPFVAVDFICECLFRHCHLSEDRPGLDNQQPREAITSKGGRRRLKSVSMRTRRSTRPISSNCCICRPFNKSSCVHGLFLRRPISKFVGNVGTRFDLQHCGISFQHNEAMPHPDRYLNDRGGWTQLYSIH
jgi:hypothetical protein